MVAESQRTGAMPSTGSSPVAGLQAPAGHDFFHRHAANSRVARPGPGMTQESTRPTPGMKRRNIVRARIRPGYDT